MLLSFRESDHVHYEAAKFRTTPFTSTSRTPVFPSLLPPRAGRLLGGAAALFDNHKAFVIQTHQIPRFRGFYRSPLTCEKSAPVGISV